MSKSGEWFVAKFVVVVEEKKEDERVRLRNDEVVLEMSS